MEAHDARRTHVYRAGRWTLLTEGSIEDRRGLLAKLSNVPIWLRRLLGLAAQA